MTKLTFFNVLKSNLKCFLCKNRNCSLRYIPQRKKEQYHGGTKYVTRCEKDKKKRENAICKK